MKKNFVRGIGVVAILYIVFNVICFAIPFARTVPFWLAYIFGSISILVQFPLVYMAFFKENTPKSRFYGFPIAQIGIFYLCAQLIFSFVTMVLGNLLPVWLIVILYVVLLALAGIGFIGVDAMRDEIERQENKLVKSVDSMRSIQAIANTLVGLCTEDAILKDVQKLVEELKYSDPVSNEKTVVVETELVSILNDLKDSVNNSDVTNAQKLCKRAMSVLTERNRLCKLNK